MLYAPIVLFAFNRPDSLKRCVESLLMNNEAAQSDLIVYVDGARSNKMGEAERVLAVQEYVMRITGFRSLTFHFSEINKRLGPSIIAGVTEVINQYERVIVIEDDLIASKNFLAFINLGLNKYAANKEVWSVCGYGNKIQIPQGYDYDGYFCSRSSSWGWGTWKDRWLSCDWDLKDWNSVMQNRKAFNRWGGSDCFSMLNNWHKGLNQSWAIRFCYNQYIQNAVTLFPIVSKIDNKGFDGTGTNCKLYNRFQFDFDNGDNNFFNLPTEIIVNKQLQKEALKYHTKLIRIYSKFMNMIYGFIN